MEVKLIKKVEAKDCTRDFFKKGEDPNKNPYAIVKIDDGSYAVVNKVTHEAIVEFKDKTKVYDETWLITLEDDTKCLMRFSEDLVVYSQPFLRTIKTFKRYLLVEEKAYKRKLIPLHDITKMEEWFSSFGALDYTVLELPNHSFTILKKEGLEVAYILFDSTCKPVFKSFVIINERGLVSVVRISDFKRSRTFCEVLPYVPIKCESYSEEYVIGTYANNTKSIMRLKDFVWSDAFDNITPITSEYALVSNKGKNDEILRLSDFQAAKFDQNN